MAASLLSLSTIPPTLLHNPMLPLFPPRPLLSGRSRRHGNSPAPVLRVAAPPASSPTAAPEEVEEGGSKFTWRDHWYPVSLLEDLDPKLPRPFQLLGREIVLWKDPKSSGWVAFDDKCTHRLAPLSEGRIDEDGCLQCSYHGWTFNGEGSCTRIPQAAESRPQARAVKSSRACATRLPTLVSQGLLFVWPDEKGREKTLSSKPPIDFDDPEFSTVTVQRDLSCGYDAFMENVSNPSHIDFAHHKVTGRRDRAKPLSFKVESIGPWGSAGSNDWRPRISAEFIAPCYYMTGT